MSRHAVKVSPSSCRCTHLDLLAALEESGSGRAEPWRPSVTSLVIPSGHGLRQTMLEAAAIIVMLPLAWALRPRKPQ